MDGAKCPTCHAVFRGDSRTCRRCGYTLNLQPGPVVYKSVDEVNEERAAIAAGKIRSIGSDIESLRAERDTLRARVEELEATYRYITNAFYQVAWVLGVVSGSEALPQMLEKIRGLREDQDRVEELESIIEWLDNYYPAQLDDARKAVGYE